MLIKIKKYLFNRYLSRWLVLAFDMYVVCFTFLLAYVLRFNFNVSEAAGFLNYLQVLLVMAVYLISFLLLKSHTGILRHSTTEDIARIILSLGAGTTFLLTGSVILRSYFPDTLLLIPYSVLIIHFALVTNILLASRVWTKALYNEWFIKNKRVKQVMIYGAGLLGQITRNALATDKSSPFRLLGFIDENATLQNKCMGGANIYSPQTALNKVIPRNNVSEIIIATDDQENLPRIKREMVNYCLPLNIPVKVVPTVDRWINGELSAKEIKTVKIEELLGRDSIKLDTNRISRGLQDTVVLVAGAAGSIGSEIVRQLIAFNAHHVILLDKAESDLYDLQNELKRKYANPKFTVFVGDVTNPVNLRRVFEKYKPNMVLNAAAYKHVPLMEIFPNEAIRVNVGGTRNLADLSLEFGVEKFVFISTDKAVNPTNVMGATKRIAEIYVQSLAQMDHISTQFITTRFGNVLGSNGSVVPLFRNQIEHGGPITVTHKDITRYFMTIPEACQLVLEASFMGKGGEIFVFDMGEPVRIYNLAEKMIYLSGFIPHEDIKIKITGLRPGEKLYEELLQDEENLLPTHNDKILIGKVKSYNYVQVNEVINNLIHMVDVLSHNELIHIMKGLVPEYIPMKPEEPRFSVIENLAHAARNQNKEIQLTDLTRLIHYPGQ